MKRNMGDIDRLIRAVIGIVLLVLGVILAGWWWIAFAVGAVLLLTAAVAWCPLYVPFKFSTYKPKK